MSINSMSKGLKEGGKERGMEGGMEGKKKEEKKHQQQDINSLFFRRIYRDYNKTQTKIEY